MGTLHLHLRLQPAAERGPDQGHRAAAVPAIVAVRLRQRAARLLRRGRQLRATATTIGGTRASGRTSGGSRNGQFRRNRALPDRSGCGFQDTDRIYHGNETSLEEFPWMALLQYRNASGFTKWACAGALINPRYVLTAAHCVTGLSRRAGNLINVRLGEHNTDTDIDCEGPRYCNERPVDVAVESTVFHDGYDRNNDNRYNDIALVRLSRPVQYSNFIRPICLPEPNEVANVGENVIVAGWGATELLTRSPIKLKLQLPIADKDQCSRTFRTAGISLRESQICAGGQEGRDSCTGDSGGPLMQTSRNDTSQWYLEGVVSFGARCGSAGWPGIYTKVESYLEWIHGAVRN
ncbi:unnamed protein product [Phaedon cochleariae]|uniref:Peptidase S1 domain-containing protein n=1 Tax=Phaedon cochleariae TaxID=80249 RepID=A0A9N9SJX2_PHACE|nr:unnamed protein product [Phaedon cochleariae]